MKILKNKKNKKGFTLVELMVSVSVFSVVMIICMGAIISVLDSNRKSQSIRAVMDNLNYALEGMTRSIRFGTSYHCGASLPATVPYNCPSGDTSITVLDSSGVYVSFELSGTKIVKSVSGGSNPGDYDLTSADVTIQSLKFYVFGSDPTDQLQPKVIVDIKGYAGKNQTQSNFNLQTTLSQRKFDYQ